jgi:hypothetical protein
MSPRALPRSLGLVLLLSLAVPRALAAAPVDLPPQSSDPPMEQTSPAISALETWTLGREDRTRLLTASEDLRITLVEIKGAELAMRLTPLDRDGGDLGVGRVLLIAPSERREVLLRTIASEPQLEGVQLRVEALRGEGRVRMIGTLSDGGELRIAPEQEGDVRRRPVRLKSTDALIDEALAAGRINQETAILYRVYSLFSDTRLPMQYRGVDREMKDSLYLIDVAEQYSSLSPATQELLLPFLTPPVYPGSWAEPNPAGKGASATPPQCGIFSANWSRVESPSGVVRVWYRYPQDALRASAIGTAVDTQIWPAFFGLMRRRPLSDQNEDCNGGSPSLDIYLTEIAGAEGVFEAYRLFGAASGAPFPGFLLVKRTASNSTVAHEVFHAFQAAFATVGAKTSSNYRWWMEGSATWAQDFVYAGAQEEHDASNAIFSRPEDPLDLEDGWIWGPCEHCYGSYLLPFYVRHKTGSADFVRVAWEGCATKPALEALDGALSGGFAKVWPEFALRNWNRDPIKDYVTWDRLERAVRPIGSQAERVQLSGRGDASLQIPVDLPRVSATYKHYLFTNDNQRTVAFWNGVTNSLSQPDEFELEDVTQDIKKGAHIDALIKVRDQDWRVEDWTNKGFVAFCRDRVSERIDELVLIISNSEFADRNRKLKHSNLAPLLWVSNMGCWQWKGTTTATLTGGGGLGSTTVKIDSVDATFTTFGLGPPLLFYSVQGNLKWQLSGDCEGKGDIAIDPAKAFLFTHNLTPPGGRKHRGYIVSSVDSRPIGGYRCRSLENGVYVWRDGEGALLPPWIFTDKVEPPLHKADANGSFVDRYDDPDGAATYTWEFKPQRESPPPPPLARPSGGQAGH